MILGLPQFGVLTTSQGTLKAQLALSILLAQENIQ